MNKIKKNLIFVLASLFILMMTAASVSANEENNPSILSTDEEPILIAPNPTNNDEPNLISPNPETSEEPNLISPNTNTDEEPLIIAPRDIKINEDTSDNSFTTSLIFVITISGIAGLAALLIIIKKKN